jgi:hypothetical protein
MRARDAVGDGNRHIASGGRVARDRYGRRKEMPRSPTSPTAAYCDPGARKRCVCIPRPIPGALPATAGRCGPMMIAVERIVVDPHRIVQIELAVGQLCPELGYGRDPYRQLAAKPIKCVAPGIVEGCPAQGSTAGPEFGVLNYRATRGGPPPVYRNINAHPWLWTSAHATNSLVIRGLSRR